MRPDLSTHTALVTWGTDGIGGAIARQLAMNNRNRVIVVGRDPKGQSCVRALQKETKNPAVEFVRADLSTIGGADLLASAILSRGGNLRYLVHSAGTITKRRTLTDDGYEMMFATNFLSRFVLSERLRPVLEQGANAEHPTRILYVNGGPRGGTLPFDEIPNVPKYSLPSPVSAIMPCERSVCAPSERSRAPLGRPDRCHLPETRPREDGLSP